MQSETCTVSFGNQFGMQKWLFIASRCEQEYNYLKIAKRASLLQMDSRELENADGHLFHACRREFTRPGLKQGCFGDRPPENFQKYIHPLGSLLRSFWDKSRAIVDTWEGNNFCARSARQLLSSHVSHIHHLVYYYNSALRQLCSVGKK